MGADLCGYILVGPKKLSAASIKKATQHAKAVQAAASEMLKKVADGLDPFKALEKDGVLTEILESMNMDDVPNEGLAQITEVNTNDIVDAAVDAWGGGHRDWMDRELPGSRTHKIGVCGNMTWGDGPEEGSAWHAMDVACRWGVLDALGIK